MIKYHLRQNNNESSAAYGKFYAYPVIEETIDLAGLAKHMEEHNTGFSEAMCIGVLKAMVKCIKEQLLAGKNVKIDDLAIFSVGIRNKGGALNAEEFSTSANIAGVKLRARATGTLSNANLNLSASIKKAAVGTGSGSESENANQGGTNGGVTHYTLGVSASPSNGGNVTGAGSYSAGASATLQATPASGYTFTRWSDGSTQNPRTVVMSENKTLTAVFTATGSGGGATPGGQEEG